MKSRSHANRGKQLERLIDKSNKEYLFGTGLMKNYIASVHKIPTPVTILKKNKNLLTGFNTRGEFVDYVGTMIGGFSIAFDAKETKGKSLPLANIHESQYKFLSTWYSLGAVTFLVVHFTDLDEYYRIDFKELREAWNNKESGKRGCKSIRHDSLKNRLVVKDGILHYMEGL